MSTVSTPTRRILLAGAVIFVTAWGFEGIPLSSKTMALASGSTSKVRRAKTDVTMPGVIVAMTGKSFRVNGTATLVYGDGDTHTSATDPFVGLVDRAARVQVWEADAGQRSAVLFGTDPTVAEPVLDHYFSTPTATLSYRGDETWQRSDPKRRFLQTMDYVDLIDLDLWSRLRFNTVASAPADPKQTTRIRARVGMATYIAALRPEVAALDHAAFETDGARGTASIDVVVDASQLVVSVHRTITWKFDTRPPFDVLESRTSDATLSNFGVKVSATPPRINSQLPSQADSLRLR
jgi:hypothetical protein